MSTNDNRRSGRQPRNGGKDYDSSNAANVIAFPSQINSGSPFDVLTSLLVLEHNRRGTLAPGIVEAFLVSVGLPVPR